MKNIIKRINIEMFRGIKNLDIENLNKINIFVGDNNVGKTSILEAIRVLGSASFNNLLQVAGSRGNSNIYFYSSFENFIYLFPRLDKKSRIHISADFYNQNYIDFDLNGRIDTVLFDLNELPSFLKERHKRLSEIKGGGITTFNSVIKQFNGLLKVNSSFLKVPVTLDVTYNYYSQLSGRRIDRNSTLVRMSYLSPLSYLVEDVFNNIIRNDIYKEICIEILHLFDKDIVDLVIMKDEEGISHTEYIKSAKKGMMPLNTYGDGIKKVLSIANGIAQAHDGILLIDEIETSIHAKYYDDIFNFIVKAVKMFNVQLFITTHSIEAMDGLLSTQSYNDTDEEVISVITLRKDNDNNTLSRTMTGKEVKNNRDKFNFEVRV